MTLSSWIPKHKIVKFCAINHFVVPCAAADDGGMYAANFARWLTADLGIIRANKIAEQMSDRTSPAVRLIEYSTE